MLTTNTKQITCGALTLLYLLGCNSQKPQSQQDKGKIHDELEPIKTVASGDTQGTAAVSKLMEMERRDKDGNIIGLLEPGLWYKRGEEQPYTGLVVGMNKPKNGKPPAFPYNYKREYKDGIQVGVETGWYVSGKKRIELVFKDGEAISMKQWDADGKEIR